VFWDVTAFFISFLEPIITMIVNTSAAMFTLSFLAHFGLAVCDLHSVRFCDGLQLQHWQLGRVVGDFHVSQ
jgi:hypothetical protein